MALHVKRSSLRWVLCCATMCTLYSRQ